MAATFEYKVDLDGFFNRVIERAQDKINAAVDDAVTELFDTLKEELSNIYRETIDEFYDAYTPDFYARNESLYDLIQFTESQDELGWSFYPERATRLQRDNGTVYKLSFLYGWHGGASGEDHNHENVSTPHWRTPYPWLWKHYGTSVRKRRPSGYYRYGREAFHSDSPYETWETRRTDYVHENGRDMFIGLLQKHINKIKWF